MSDINTRISDLIDDLKLSKNQFARKINSSSAMVSKITNQKTNFGKDMLEKIITAYPGLNAGWLLTGVGEMWDDKIIDTGKQSAVKTKFIIDIKIMSDAEFITKAQECSKKINYLYQKLVDMRVLLFQELKIKGALSTKVETDLLNTLARPSVQVVNDENILRYPYENLNNDDRLEYLKKVDACINLFNNTFFECFEQFYKALRVLPHMDAKK